MRSLSFTPGGMVAIASWKHDRFPLTSTSPTYNKFSGRDFVRQNEMLQTASTTAWHPLFAWVRPDLQWMALFLWAPPHRLATRTPCSTLPALRGPRSTLRPSRYASPAASASHLRCLGCPSCNSLFTRHGTSLPPPHSAAAYAAHSGHSFLPYRQPRAPPAASHLPLGLAQTRASHTRPRRPPTAELSPRIALARSLSPASPRAASIAAQRTPPTGPALGAAPVSDGLVFTPQSCPLRPGTPQRHPSLGRPGPLCPHPAAASPASDA